MSILFEAFEVGNMEIKNRFIRSATYYALSDEEGFVGQASVDLMRELAENEVGLIMTGFAYVLKNGQSVPDQNGIQDDDHIPGYVKMAEAVHEAGGKVVMQIVHGGANAYTTSFYDGDYLAVSLIENMPTYRKKAREMNDDDIGGIIAAFGEAGRRVQEAGLDGVQIHGAHGYLVSQFLSPQTNRRKDQWGGSLENRMRFVIEVTRAIKKEVDDDFPIMIKLGCRDYLGDGSGLTLEEGAQVAKTLEDEGLCLVEVSHGISTETRLILGITKAEQEGCFVDDTRAVRAATSGPLCVVAGFRSLGVMEETIKSGVADFIGISRPLIREPGIIKRWKSGDMDPSECLSCGGCFNRTEKGKHSIHCRQLEKKTA